MTGGGRDSAAPDLPSIARLIARLAVNAHTITGGAGIDRVGLGLYPGPGAMANHGEPPAGPTAVQAFEGGTLTLRALAALPSGAEVMLSYVDPATPRPARRVALLEGYRFDIDAGLLPQPPPAMEWASPDGSTLAAGFSARPPSVDGDPEACVAMVGPAGEPGGGAVAWLESGSSQDGVDAAASFGLGVEEDGQERGPPPRPSVCRVVAWGGCAASPAFLARTAACLATMERAARGVETCPGRPVAGALTRARGRPGRRPGGGRGWPPRHPRDRPGPGPSPGPRPLLDRPPGVRLQPGGPGGRRLGWRPGRRPGGYPAARRGPAPGGAGAGAPVGGARQAGSPGGGGGRRRRPGR